MENINIKPVYSIQEWLPFEKVLDNRFNFMS